MIEVLPVLILNAKHIFIHSMPYIDQLLSVH